MPESAIRHFDKVDREARDFLIPLFQRFLDAEISQYDFEDALWAFLLARVGYSMAQARKKNITVYKDRIIHEIAITVQAWCLSIGPEKLVGDWALDSNGLAQANRLMLFLRSDRPFVEPPFRSSKSIFARLLDFVCSFARVKRSTTKTEEDEGSLWDLEEYSRECWPFFSLEEYADEQRRQGIPDCQQQSD